MTQRARSRPGGSRSSAAFPAAILDALPFGIALIGSEGSVVYSNATLDSLLDAGPATGLSVGQLGTRLRGLHLAARYSRAIASREPSGVKQIPIELPGGRKRAVSASLLPIEADGAVLLVIEDSGASSGGEAPKNEERLLSMAAAASDDAVLGVDSSGAVRAWNRGAKRIFGFTDAEFEGYSLLGLFPEETTKSRLKLESLSRSGSVRNVETQALTKSGRRIPVLVTETPIREGRQMVGASVVIKELAEVRALHEKTIEAQRLKTLLETVVSVNHEINNPLAIVMGNLQLLLRSFEAGPPGIRAKLRAADKAGRRISEVIRHLSTIVEPVGTEYLKGRGITMIDLRRSKAR